MGLNVCVMNSCCVRWRGRRKEYLTEPLTLQNLVLSLTQCLAYLLSLFTWTSINAAITSIYTHHLPILHTHTHSVLDRHVLPAAGHLLLSLWTSAASQAPPFQGGPPLTPSLLPALRTVLPHTQAVSQHGVGVGKIIFLLYVVYSAIRTHQNRMYFFTMTTNCKLPISHRYKSGMVALDSLLCLVEVSESNFVHRYGNETGVALHLLGMLNLRLNQTKEAVKHFSAALKYNSGPS